MRDTPKQAPTAEQIAAAGKVYSDWQLHYYQLLYFQRPPLTSPGDVGSPLTVAFYPKHWGCLRVVAEQAPEYSFTIHNQTALPQDEYDAQVLAKCRAILTAIREKREKAHPRMCCPLAERRACVCNYSYACPIHGGPVCSGSHD